MTILPRQALDCSDAGSRCRRAVRAAPNCRSALARALLIGQSVRRGSCTDLGLRPAVAGACLPAHRPTERCAGTDALRIEHIGSTAIPMMDAKDILDVQVSVADLDSLRHNSTARSTRWVSSGGALRPRSCASGAI